MPANLENVAVTTGLERVSFHSNPKERQCQRCSVSQLCSFHMLQGYAQNPPAWLHTWPENFQMYKLDLEKAEEPEIKLPRSAGSSRKQESSRKTSASALLTTSKPLTVWVTKNCGKFFKRWEYLTCLLRNLYAGQEATVRTRHGTTDWFQIGKGVRQGCILSPYLFNL